MSGLDALADSLSRAAASILALLEHERAGIALPDELKAAAMDSAKELLAFAGNLKRHENEAAEDEQQRH